MQQRQLIIDIQNNNLINIQDWLKSGGAQCQEQAATEHLQQFDLQHFKKKKKETKWSLLSKM